MEIHFGEWKLSHFILWPLVIVSLGLASILLRILYNVTLHPLSKYPGPKLWAATRIPYALMIIRGDPHTTILDLHRRYNADIIRVAPDELSFQHPDAWKDIMGHRGKGVEENDKDPYIIDEVRNHIIAGERHDHTRYRRILSHSFSARSMQEQQPLIIGYVNLLLERLHSIAGQGPVNMVSWYNFTTFDVIGDLAFGQSFGCLEKSGYHPWVSLIFNNSKMRVMMNTARRFGPLASLLKKLVPRSVVEKGKAHNALVRERVNQRMALNTPRPDFAEAMIRRKGSESLSQEEIYENSGVLIVAGSETTATALSGATYFLTANPDTLARLSNEIRSSFTSEDEINLLSTAKLDYLNAVIEESLRMYPPVPGARPRVTPPEGAEILGQWIPGNTTVGIGQWAMFHNEKLFSRPFEFHPERFLGDPAFAGDSLDALKPFHIGPRNCLGMNLAYAEMRVILSRVVWAFDMRLEAGSRGWDQNQTNHTLWDKPPLMIHLTPRKSS
ncbi:cytochrome P450 [Colletotrichum sublineola]|uniref:Putative cytochrome P450 n=1 Tax=Colletotrichum sublineola TaxID=1173701 RepID=A0A066XK03_COLSU|nr:cytochrome P450 [Colletotrichum sublineola]KDN69202.1 putative cytochrome P450 [Colletotrichum sublineola]